MKTSLISILIYSVCATAALAQYPQRETAGDSKIVSVKTAPNHLTVLEFGEPVTMAASGSSAYHIERQQDKVLIEPTNAAGSTDLLVWTTSRRFTFELEPAGEAGKMDVAIDMSVPAPKPVVTTEDQLQQIADNIMKQALFGAEPIDSRTIKSRANIVVRVQQVFRTRSTVYIHYQVENHTDHPFRIAAPNVKALKMGLTAVSVSGLRHTQLDDKTLGRLGRTSSVELPVALAESDGQDVAAHDQGQGIIAIRQDLQAPAVLQLEFSSAVKATFVL